MTRPEEQLPLTSPFIGSHNASTLEAETFDGFTCLKQQAKKLYCSRWLALYQEVLAQSVGREFGRGTAKGWENFVTSGSIQLRTTA
jgi:hypothetical protein